MQLRIDVSKSVLVGGAERVTLWIAAFAGMTDEETNL